MIRGMLGVVPHHAMETGRFYMAPAYNGGNWLFQCVQTPEPYEDTYLRKALGVLRGGKPELILQPLPYSTPVVALDEVRVRVDPTSLSKSAFDTYLESGMFLVRDDEPILCAPTDQFRRSAVVNLATGRVISDSIGTNWLSFGRWSLVMDDEQGDELTIASFGDETSPET